MLFGIILFVVLMFLGYLVISTYGLIMLGAGEIVPGMLIFLASAIVLGFSTFKTGGTLFRSNGYQVIVAMPIKTSAMVIGRFVRLYVDSLIEATAIMLPGLTIYMLLMSPGPVFALYALLTVFLVPFIPLSVAVLLGVLVSGISSRMKHRAIWEAVLSIVFVFVIFGALSGLSRKSAGFNLEEIKNAVYTFKGAIDKAYPPAAMLGEGMKMQDFTPLGWVFLISVAVFFVVLGITVKCFHGICRKLQSGVGSKKHRLEAIDLKKVQPKAAFRALVARDAARYFASGAYISNTIMGPIMAVAAAVGLFVADTEKLTEQINFSVNIWQAVPLLIGAFFCTTTPLATSISMEGKEWWILKTLPLTNKMILDSKLAFNLLLYAPFYGVVQVLLMIKSKGGVIEAVWSILLMALVIICLCMFSLTMNLKFPKMEWDNEVMVIKQSASAGLSIIGMFVMILLGGVVLILPISGLLMHLVRALIAMMLAGITLVLYRMNLKMDLRTI